MAHNPSFPCTFTNGLAMGEGLSKLIDWLREEVEPWIASVIDLEVPSLVSELSHIQQVVFFLVTQKNDPLLEKFHLLFVSIHLWLFPHFVGPVDRRKTVIIIR